MSSDKPAMKNILLIDDDDLVLATLSKLFLRDGWSVSYCQSGEEGLKKISEERYDCVLLDVRMPGMSGDEVLARLRKMESDKQLNSQKVIIMTGFADDNAIVNVFELGATHYVRKPIDINEILAKAHSCAGIDYQGEIIDATDRDDDKEFKKIRKLYDKESMDKKVDILSRKLNLPLVHIKGCTFDTNTLVGNIENPIGICQVPLSVTGPAVVDGKHAKGSFYVPFATTEGALIMTYDVGLRMLSMGEPIYTEVVSKVIHISPIFYGDEKERDVVSRFVEDNFESIKKVAEGQSRHTTLLQIDRVTVGENLVLRFRFDTADAHGLNMINQGAFNACKFIQARTDVPFFHRSHYSGVKHHSLLNETEGYGRCVRASALITSKALAMLKVDAQIMKRFFDKCIECGTRAKISAVNVHAANALAAIFIACGQDVADISSSHVCETTVDIVNSKDLRINIELKNLLVATVGGGTGLGTQRECLKIMDCYGSGKSDQFAEIIAAVVLAGEFPTAAAVINETYVDIHNKYGRNKPKDV